MKIHFPLIFSFLLIALLGSVEASDRIEKNIYQEDGVDFLKLPYKTKRPISFGQILRKYIRRDVIVRKSTRFVELTIEKNPDISEWKNISVNQRLTLYINTDYLLPFVRQKYIEEKKEEKEKKEELDKVKDIIAKDEDELPQITTYKKSVFYMYSTGSFSEQRTTGKSSVVFGQTSPITVGASLTYQRALTKWSINGSLYYAKFYPAENSSGQRVDIIDEVGLTLYYQYPFKPLGKKIFLYSGLDHENFSTFDFTELNTNGNLVSLEHKINWLTFGTAVPFTLFNKKFYTKASLSQSILTQSSSNLSFSGTKFLFYLRGNAYKKLFLHGLTKFHSLKSESTSLSIVRIGLGVGYDF